ncbi:2-hydroxyacid dehydrogenase [Pollutimonas sp. H1-120]|uniref:2-hydroxyacid dehydrogenase n=1 Tax=Pollutimonas sp. H1-120 TaxID=3148824 RepID=UPI003B52381E
MIPVFYNSYATEQVYDIIRGAMPNGFKLLTLSKDSDAERMRLASECEVAICAAHPLSAEIIHAATRLRLVHHQGVGYHDTVDIAALRERKIALALTPEGTTTGVAEHTVLLMLAACKQLSFADSELRQGRFHINELRPVSREVSGMTIGYIGMGRIAQAVAERLRPFETRGIYYDQYTGLNTSREQALGLERMETLEALLQTADIVTLHLPLTPLTRHLINAGSLAKMKRGSILINTARGSLVDNNALADALAGRHLAAAGLDVFEQEPLPISSPLVGLPNIILTPHIAAGTRDALTTKMRALFANIERFYQGMPLRNQVALD